MDTPFTNKNHFLGFIIQAFFLQKKCLKKKKMQNLKLKHVVQTTQGENK